VLVESAATLFLHCWLELLRGRGTLGFWCRYIRLETAVGDCLLHGLCGWPASSLEMQTGSNITGFISSSAGGGRCPQPVARV